MFDVFRNDSQSTRKTSRSYLGWLCEEARETGRRSHNQTTCKSGPGDPCMQRNVSRSKEARLCLWKVSTERARGLKFRSGALPKARTPGDRVARGRGAREWPLGCQNHFTFPRRGRLSLLGPEAPRGGDLGRVGLTRPCRPCRPCRRRRQARPSASLRRRSGGRRPKCRSRCIGRFRIRACGAH